MNFPSHRLSIDDSIVCCATHARVVKLVRVHLVMIMMMLLTMWSHVIQDSNPQTNTTPLAQQWVLGRVQPRCMKCLRHCIESGIRAYFTAARTLHNHMAKRAEKARKHDLSVAKIIACFQTKHSDPYTTTTIAHFWEVKDSRDSAAKAEKGTLQWPG